MNFIERNKTKIVILLVAIPFLILYMFPKTIVYIFTDLSDELITLLFLIVFFLPIIFYFIYKSYTKKKRIIDLKEYAEKHNYDFYENPNQEQISIFRKFKSMGTINDQNEFFNLLVPKDDNQTKPLIVTGKTKIEAGEYSTIYYTQIFLYKNNTELPKFYIKRKTWFDSYYGDRAELNESKKIGIATYKFKKKEFPRSKYFFFSESPNIENFISNKFIELLNAGINRKKALINIESNGINLIFYKQWSRHSIDLMDFYSNLFRVLKESLIK